MPKCGFEDFKKEDKVKLLIWVLSNDQVITALHEVLFGPELNRNAVESKTTGLIQYESETPASKQKSCTTTGKVRGFNTRSIDRVGLGSEDTEAAIPGLPDLRNPVRRCKSKLGGNG